MGAVLLLYTDVEVVVLLTVAVRHTLHTSPVAPAVVEEPAEETNLLLDTSSRALDTLQHHSSLYDLSTLI